MNGVVQRLTNLFTSELQSPGKSLHQISEILTEIRPTEKLFEFAKTFSDKSDSIDVLIKCCDGNVGLIRVLYPTLYALVQLKSDDSLSIVCQFIPTLIWQYLSNVGSENLDEAESILMHLANTLSDKTGFSFRLPSIHMISVYHHPAKMQYTGGLTEASLSKGFNMDPVYSEAPPATFTNITAANRLTVLTLLLEKYNLILGDTVPASRERFCWLCIWVCGSGMVKSAFPSMGDMQCWSLSANRFTMGKDFMAALVSGLQYALYHGQDGVAKQALDIVAVRAEYEVSAEVMMLVASLQDTLKIAHVNPAAKPFGIQMPSLSGTQDDMKPVRRSIVRHEDIAQLRKRVSSNEIREESENEGPSPASVIVDCEDSDESDIHIATFRGGKLQNSMV